jgi:hypothetical protein
MSLTAKYYAENLNLLTIFFSLRNPNTCPNQGQRSEKCDCYQEKKGLSGLTVFSKIRINPQSLKVTSK